MRITSAALLTASAALLTATLSAQTARPAAHHAASAPHTAAAAPGHCVTLPELSSKIPALVAGSPCPRALYTMSTVPDIHLDYVSPVEGDLAAELGIKPSSFTLAYVDTHVGAGPLVAQHKHLTVKYTGYLADGTVFDSSDNHPGSEPFSFQLGEHQVVAGWDTGFAGMHVGGKRRLFIPFQLAYGPNGRPPTIPARAQLIFDMEVVSQSDTEPTPPAPPAAAQPQMPTPQSATPPASAPEKP